MQKVDALRRKVFEMQRNLEDLRTCLKDEEKMLQDMCSHDDFWAEENGDYHRPGYYYICKCCRYLTQYRPQSYTIR